MIQERKNAFSFAPEIPQLAANVTGPVGCTDHAEHDGHTDRNNS